MAQSIGRAQAEALAEGFLNSIGSNPEYSDFIPNATLTSLITLAALIIQEANSNLDKGGHTSSGSLSDSLKVRDPQVIGGDITLDIEANFYYQFLNRGVKGINGGSGEFSFKTPFPSKKMVDSIRGWMKRAGMSTANVKKTVSNLERKNKSISQFDKAYVVARAIKIKGIRKTGFFDRAVKEGQRYATQELGKALAVDIVKSLPKNINGTSN